MTIYAYERLYRRATLVGCVMALSLCGGCASPWWNSFLNPTELGNFREDRVQEIRKTISFRDKGMEVPGATDPTPEDLIATVETYRIGPGDAISIRMLDFLAPDVETEFTPQADELGYIDVPQLGYIYVEGLSAHELREELIRQAKAAEIFRQDSEPTVIVNVIAQQHRIYEVDGAIAQPGRYRIINPRMRLREALLQAGGLNETVKMVYVFRGAEQRERVNQSDIYRTRSAPEAPAEDLPAPPVTPAFLSETAAAPEPPRAGATPTASTPQGTPPSSVEEEMLKALEGGDTQETRETSTTTNGGGAKLPPYVIFDEEWEVAPEEPSNGAPPNRESSPGTARQRPAPNDTQDSGTRETGPVDWEELASDGDQRVIRIPAEKLRLGDANYNIVVEHKDYIRVDPGPVGIFYLGGHVVRPGTYALQGEYLTLTQALVSAGELDQLAWPTRCEIRRRIDGDREEITQWNLERIVAGQDPDLFIKPNDVIRVGTHAVAPFLATIRNSFRMTYGFGFVYDRNFADYDAYGAQFNPQNLQSNQGLFSNLFR